jgi:hypothetical protein
MGGLELLLHDPRLIHKRTHDHIVLGRETVLGPVRSESCLEPPGAIQRETLDRQGVVCLIVDRQDQERRVVPIE